MEATWTSGRGGAGGGKRAKGLKVSKEDRETNLRRRGDGAGRVTRNGVAVIRAAISPYAAVRDEVRARIGDFVEVHVDCSSPELTRRDVKGLYEKALRGEIKNFTGVSDPYEPPDTPEVTVSTDRETAPQSTAVIVNWLEQNGFLA